MGRLLQIAPRASGLKLLDHFPTGNMVWLERYLHEAFAHRRVRLEWFRLTAEDVKLIRSITAADGVDDLPPAIAAQHTLNEANGFVWGEQDDMADIPRRTSRVAVQFPTDWANLIKKFAAERRMPVSWFLVELIQKDAIKLGITDLPVAPWDE